MCRYAFFDGLSSRRIQPVRRPIVCVKNYRQLADLDIDIRAHAVLVRATDVVKTLFLRIPYMLLGASTAQISSR